MFFIICDIGFIVLGIPSLFSMYKWKKKIETEIRNGTSSENEINRKLRTCKQSGLIAIILIVVGIMDLANKVIKK